MDGVIGPSPARSALPVEELEALLREAREQRAATAEILRAISSSAFDIQAVFETVVRSATALCGADGGQLFIRDGEEYRLAVARGGSTAYRELLARNPISPGRGTLVGKVALERRTVQIPDVLADRDYQWSEAQKLGETRTLLGVPMLREGAPLGVIVLLRTEVRPFTERQIELVTTFAAQGVIAVENVRLFRELEDLNRTLEGRVRRQVEELERFGRLRRFLSPQVADLLVSSGDEGVLESHRRRIAAFSASLRGFTSFAESAEPEEVMAVLREYHEAVGSLIHSYGGTVGHFAGDVVMVFFNDPLPCPDAAWQAVALAVAMREQVGRLAEGWRKRGHELGLGVGIALGHATLGKIGFEGRYDYAAVGPVTELASRLCEEAAPGQVLITQRVHAEVEGRVDAQPLGPILLRGFAGAVPAMNVLGLRAAEGPLDGDGESRGERPAGLTEREVEVLRLVAEGLTDAQVAERLVVSTRTASSHLYSIYSKLGVGSRTAAARFALDHGLL